MQDTIVKAWSNFDKFTAGTDLRAWLFTILRNTFFSSKRKRKREVADPDGAHAATLFDKRSTMAGWPLPISAGPSTSSRTSIARC